MIGVDSDFCCGSGGAEKRDEFEGFAVCDVTEVCEMLDAAVEAEDAREPDVEKVKLAFVETDLCESFDIRELRTECDRERARAS